MPRQPNAANMQYIGLLLQKMKRAGRINPLLHAANGPSYLAMVIMVCGLMGL